jgi:C4-dicarboxylate-binding protein DctP
MILLLLCSACERRLTAYRFRYAHSQPDQHPRSESMRFFEKEIEHRTSGRIEVENYFSGVLGNERELMDMVATGVLQGTRGGLFGDANPKYNLFLLPFLVRDWDEALRLVNSEFTARVNGGARRNGFHVPACGISQGFRAHTNSVRPIRTPDDLEGLKMRVPPQEVYVVSAKAFSVNPQEIPYIEVYQAAKTGVIDGQDNAPSNIWAAKIHEVQTYLSISNYSTGPDPLMINLDWYESLPEPLREVFDEVARAAIRYSDRMNRDSEAEYIKRLAEKLETNYMDEEALRALQARAEPVYTYFVEKGDFTWEEIAEARRAARASE